MYPTSLPNYARGDEPLGVLYGYDMGRLNKLVALKRNYDPEQFFSAMTPIPLELPEDVLSQTEKRDENRLKIQGVLDGKKKPMEGGNKWSKDRQRMLRKLQVGALQWPKRRRRSQKL
ncbi:hypothetical protein HOY80DRAFT_1001107 [Tuber brumale]|nr:hypothetical protein HOY80DRAFT_1001107 [Tuber brumale]